MPLLGAGYIHTVKSRHQESSAADSTGWSIINAPTATCSWARPGWPSVQPRHRDDGHLRGLRLSGDPSLKRAARRAIEFIVDAQDPVGGGWRYSPGQSGDTSVFGWQIFALRSGHIAGLHVPRKVLKACSRYLDMAAVTRNGSSTPISPAPRRCLDAVMTAEALLSRQLLGWPRDFPPLIKGVGQISAHLQQSSDRNIYYWYYATQLLHNMGSDKWERWNLKIREGLIRMQVKDSSCAREAGILLPRPISGAHGRPPVLTSLSILTLEVYYRYLPLYRTYDDDQAKPDSAMEAKDDDKAK